MIRYLIAAVAILCASPVAAQTITGCSSVASNRVATSKDVAKLTADANCFDEAKANAEARAAVRRARIAAIAVPPRPPAQPTTTGIPAKIASNFDRAAFLTPSWGTGAIAPSGLPDSVGAFRFLCQHAKFAPVDPIVYPGLVGMSHLHEFFGNTAVDENSTYESLRTTGESTCGNKLNRSGYWNPAMLDGRGNAIVSEWLSIYYKRLPKTSAECQKQGKECVDTPRGLRFVFGHNMLDHTDPPTGSAYFNCAGPGAKEGHYKDIVEAAPNCPVGSLLGMVQQSPDCWNGKDLDSPDHRSHIAYSDYGQRGYRKCPDTHPYVIPQFTMANWWTVDASLDRSGKWDGSRPTWRLSSDVMPGGKLMRPGSTPHGDWFGAWDDETMEAWHTNCIEKLLSCNGGDLGNGWQIKDAWGVPYTGPRLVPVSAR